MAGLLDFARRIAASKIQVDTIEFGPWKGSMRSKSADQVPPEYLAESNASTPSSNYRYLPRTGTFVRRKGTSIKFDVHAAVVGLLPAEWGYDTNGLALGRLRDFDEFKSESISDHVPTLISLVTKEAAASGFSGLDDGKFSQVYLRDQVNSVNYTLGAEYGSTFYPTPGSEQYFKWPALWHDSGDGGLVRGTTEFQRRFVGCGSRRMLKVGNWTYLPSLNGTPVRWRGMFGASSTFVPGQQTAVGTSDATNVGFSRSSDAGTSNLYQMIDDATEDTAGTDYVLAAYGGAPSFGINLGSTVTDPGVNSGHVIKITARVNGTPGADDRLNLTFSCNGTSIIANETLGNLTASFQTFTRTLSAVEAAQIRTLGTYAQLRVGIEMQRFGAAGAATENQCSWIQFSTGSSDPNANAVIKNRLMPSGPLPPLHCGTAAADTQVSATSTFIYPDADSVDGTWTKSSGGNTDLYSMIDETAADDDTDYITTTTAATDICEVRLGDLGFVPSTDDVVTVRFRNKRAALNARLRVDLFELVGGATKTVRATGFDNPGSTAAFANYSFVLSASEIASISDWTNLFFRFTHSSTGGSATNTLARARVEHSGEPATAGGWKGSDKFFRSMAYRAWDDSVWMPCLPRHANTNLPSGYNLTTVDAANPSANYQKMVWSNMPVPPFDIKSKLPLRSHKIDSSTQSDQVLVPEKLYVIDEIDASVTTYEDFKADDDALQIDPDQLVIRLDHIMNPAARYMFGGDSRACVSYGRQNPCAIQLAPIGATADYDRNVADTTTSAYASATAMYMRLDVDTSSVYTLNLVKSTGSVNTTKSFALATYDTLEELIDAINATTCATDSMQWRAQGCPGANLQAASSYLTPHYRAIASCVIDDTAKTIAKTAGGLSAVPVGAYVLRAGVATSAYITKINSDTSLTYTGTITSGTQTCQFYAELGDAPISGTDYGYQRVIAGSLPGFLYFTTTYLTQTALDKSAVWMTVASPGSMKSAPNCFSGSLDNKFIPPLEAGISMGGAAVDRGFFVAFHKKRGVIINPSNINTGIDRDYKLVMTNESSGCIAWNSVRGGTRFAACFAPEGLYGCDLEGGEILLTRDTYRHPKSDAFTGTGDFTYEAPACDAATAADNDGAYLSAHVLRNSIWINYRASGAHPNRQVEYDYSAGRGIGLQLLVRPGDDRWPGDLWGWSLPLVRSIAGMCEGRRSGSGVDGVHLYGWSELNLGTTGDGRIDELEIGETDNSAPILASGTTAFFKGGTMRIVMDDIVVEHATPAGATAKFDCHRVTASDFTQEMSLTASSMGMVSDLKSPSTESRVPGDSVYFGFRQTAGTAHEIKKIILKFLRTKRYRPAA